MERGTVVPSCSRFCCYRKTVFIDKAYADQVKGWLKMSQVARLCEEEKIEAVNLAVSQAVSQAKKEQKKQKEQIARNLIESGVDILTVMKSTGLTRDEINGLSGE